MAIMYRLSVMYFIVYGLCALFVAADVSSMTHEDVENYIITLGKDLGDSRVNDLLDKRMNEIIQTRMNDIVEKHMDDIVEKRINNLVEKRINEIVDKRVSELIEKRMNDLVEDRISEILDKRVAEVTEKLVKLVDTRQDTQRKSANHISHVVNRMFQERGESTSPGMASLQRRFVLDNAPYPGGIGFTACVSVSDLTNLGEHHTILFDRVITNAAHSYHNHTGIFIAPIKGLYVFHLTAMSTPHRTQYLAFVKDGTTINHVYPDADNSADYGTSGNLWVMELDVGSEIWIRTLGAGQIHGNCFTVFSGFMLYELE